uniref:Uncharacterized protein n=1 Tax=Cairina moschata TaxID=8855 RepID=A0A8C3GQW7_CAIMO
MGTQRHCPRHCQGSMPVPQIYNIEFHTHYSSNIPFWERELRSQPLSELLARARSGGSWNAPASLRQKD